MIIYITLRYIWLLGIASAMPGAIWYLHLYYGDALPFARVPFMLLIMLAGTVFQTIFVIVSQALLPTSPSKAVLVIALLFANGVTGFTAADFQLFYAFYAVAITQMLAFCLYLIWYLAQYALPKRRAELFFVMSERATFILFFCILVTTMLIVYTMSVPLTAELFDETSLPLKLAALSAFAADLGANTTGQIKHNMMHARHEKSRQAQVATEFAWPIALTITFSMLVSVVLAAVTL